MPRIKRSSPLSNDGVQSVMLAVELLDAVSNSETAMRITDLAERLGTTKARVYRHLRTLASHGYIVQDAESGRYYSGPQLILLGQKVIENLSLVHEGRAAILGLCAELGHSVGLSQMIGENLHTVDVARGSTPFSITTLRGTRQIYHATALGKVALAFGPPELTDRILAGPLPAITPETITDPTKLRREVAAIAERGWAQSPNEMNIGINALAAPIFDVRGRFVGAVAILDTVHLLSSKPTPQQIEATCRTAREISRRLGHSGEARQTQRLSMRPANKTRSQRFADEKRQHAQRPSSTRRRPSA